MKHLKMAVLIIIAVLFLMPAGFSSATAAFVSTENSMEVAFSTGTVTYDDGGGGILYNQIHTGTSKPYSITKGRHNLTSGDPFVSYTSGKQNTVQVTVDVQFQLSPYTAADGASVYITLNGQTKNIDMSYGRGYISGFGPVTLDSNRHADLHLSVYTVHSKNVSFNNTLSGTFLVRVYDGDHLTEYLLEDQRI